MSTPDKTYRTAMRVPRPEDGTEVQMLRVVRGEPPDDELAALIAVLASLPNAAAEPLAQRSAWADPAHRLLMSERAYRIAPAGRSSPTITRPTTSPPVVPVFGGATHAATRQFRDGAPSAPPRIGKSTCTRTFDPGAS